MNSGPPRTGDVDPAAVGAAQDQVRRQSEILAKVTDGVVVVAAQDGSIVYCNAALESMFGYDRGELLGQPVARLNAPTMEAPAATARAIMDALGCTGRWDGEILNQRKDGSTFWTFTTISCHELPGWGAVWLGIQRDVSAQRRAEGELRLREGYIRAIFDNFPFLAWIKDRNGRYLMANQALADAARVADASLLVGMPEPAIWPLGVAERLQADERQVLDSGQPLTTVYRSPEPGRRIWWEVVRSPIEFDGESIGTAGFARDVSDRHLADDALRERQGWLHAIVEQLPVGVAVLDQAGQFLLSNALMRSLAMGAQMPSFSEEQVARWEACDAEGGRLPPDEWPGARALRGESVRSGIEFTHRSPQGETRSLLVSAIPFRGPGDAIAGAVAVVQDISERKLSEAALRDSEQRFRALVMASSDIVYCMNHDWTQMQSLDGREFIADTTTPSSGWLQQYIPPDARAEVLQHIGAAIQSRGAFNLEHRVHRKDGSIAWVHSRAVPILDERGGIRAWIGMASDVTGRKNAEHALRASEELLRTIAENSHDDIFYVDRSHRIEYLNPAGLEFMRRALQDPGLRLEQLAGRTTWEVLGDNPMTRAFRELDEQAMASGQASSVEDVVGCGALARSRLTLRTPIRNARGDIVGLVGIARDITARKREEAARLGEVARQRDALVREVHHRIKNHLQGVLGLLRLQIDRQPELAAALAEVMAQVYAIAGVYGLRGQSASADLDLARIVDLVVQGAGAAAHVRWASELDGAAYLNEADAVPVALAVNELVANACKHLSHVDPARPVRITLRGGTGGVCVEVRNGPASLPAGFDFAGRRGIGTGLQLLATLLPSQGARLRLQQQLDEVCAELVLQAPVVARRDSPAAGPP